MKRLALILDIIDRLNEYIGKCISFTLIALVCIVVYDVILRYFFNDPTLWGFEMAGFILLAVTFIGGGYTLLHRAHVNVDIFYMRLSAKGKAWIDLFTYPIFLFGCCYVLIWWGAEVSTEAFHKGYRTESMWAPLIWPSYAIIPIGAFLIGIQGLGKWIRDLVKVIKGEEVGRKMVSREGIRGIGEI